MSKRLPSLAPAQSGPGDRYWYKNAIFYQVLVRGFFDSNGDGIGDLDGLREKLDHLQWLGVDCIWLLPICESPLRDGGYDVADFKEVQPTLGNVGTLRALIDEVHSRGMYIITDFVLNHTSDEHSWFKASRADPDGPYGDFYVWSDTDALYGDARIIFTDSESSNWTYDEVRGQYFWHRFYSHQPDLNYENPAVQEAMLDVLRFWLDMGIDGFRLDAVPFLFEREGTDCENLPDTHDYLKRLRAEVDRLYPGKMLLAEADEWPIDVIEYFGDPAVGGDECNMAFHFPLMPRLFIALKQEKSHPISEILANTPKLPENCQWAIFLRNHDELTLNMVSDDERAYMYEKYVTHPRMRVNTGIRRRLAPLLDNDRDQIELFTALLMSLPGSPVIYYGDEIGMGDNIWLEDRDGVRTPMQWSPGPNAGFSECEPAEFYLPVVDGADYGPDAVNVADQMGDPSSLLQFTKRMIAVRREYPVFGAGAYEELEIGNQSVLAFVRRHEKALVVCLHNMSSRPQPVSLDLSRFEGQTPIDCLDSRELPAVVDAPYELTLPKHGFKWFSLVSSDRFEDVLAGREINVIP